MRVRDAGFLLVPVLVFPTFFLYAGVMSAISTGDWIGQLEYMVYLVMPLVSIAFVSISFFKLKTTFDSKRVAMSLA